MNSPVSDNQATLAVIRRTETEVATKQRRLRAFQDAGEEPPARLAEDLSSDLSFLNYLRSLTS
jgi:hypothetical protein